MDVSQEYRTGRLRLDQRAVTYDEAGDGPGRPLLLVHGLAGGREDFRGVLPELGDGRRVLAIDLPGHGDSDGLGPEAAYSLPSLAAWLLGVATALGVGELHLLGHGLGGLVAQRLAAAASQRLRSLVLADSGLGAPHDEAAAAVVRVAVAARERGLDAAAEAVLEHLGDGAVDEAARARMLERFRALDERALLGTARCLLRAEPLGAFLRGIDVPVLVVHGEAGGPWAPGAQRLLAATVAGARRAAVPGAGACAHRERPEAWVTIVASFLEEAESRPKPGHHARVGR